MWIFSCSLCWHPPACRGWHTGDCRSDYVFLLLVHRSRFTGAGDLVSHWSKAGLSQQLSPCSCFIQLVQKWNKSSVHRLFLWRRRWSCIPLFLCLPEFPLSSSVWVYSAMSQSNIWWRWWSEYNQCFWMRQSSHVDPALHVTVRCLDWSCFLCHFEVSFLGGLSWLSPSFLLVFVIVWLTLFHFPCVLLTCSIHVFMSMCSPLSQR